MADTPVPKASETEDLEASKRKHRVLRAAPEQPTTLREQSEKAQANVGRSSKRGRVLQIISIPFRIAGRFLAKVFRPLGRFKFFRAIGYVLVPPYFRNSWKELTQVTWPDRRQTRRLTFAVILFSVIFGTIVAGVDFGLDKLFRTFILNK